uniref:SPK domain-containing protein n=1 Tax=Caenorhabditis tropicalis TaxID=1561998 RepID=A0A1I7U5S5_9PELO
MILQLHIKDIRIYLASYKRTERAHKYVKVQERMKKMVGDFMESGDISSSALYKNNEEVKDIIRFTHPKTKKLLHRCIRLFPCCQKQEVNALDESCRGLYKIESCQLHRLAIPLGSQKGNALPRRHHSGVIQKSPDTLTSIGEEQKKTRTA